MPLETSEQQAWVARFTGTVVDGGDGAEGADKKLYQQFLAVRAKEEAADQAMKDVLIDQVHRRVAKEKARFRKAFIFDVELEGKKSSTMGAKGDQSQALDSDEAGPKLTKQVDAATIKLGYEAQGILSELKELLAGQVTTRTSIKQDALVEDKSAPLFTKPEIREELYDPLVRELVIPENFIPNDFSRTKQMLDATNEFYLEDLAKYNEPDEISETLGDVKTLVGAAATAVQAIAAVEIKSEEAANLASTITELTQAVFNTGVDAVIGLRKKQGAQGVQTVVGDVSSAISTAIGAATGNSDLASYIADGMQAAANVGVMFAALTADEPQVDVFIDNLGKAIGQGISAAGAGQTGQAATIFSDVSAGVSAGFSQAAGAVKGKLVYHLRVGDWSEAGSILAGAAVQAIQTDFSVYRGQLSLDASDEEKKEISEAGAETDEMLGEAAKGFSEFFDQDAEAVKEKKEQFKAAAEKKKEELKKQKEELDKKETEDAEARLAKEQEEYQRSLEHLGKSEQSDQELKSIAKLIEDMKRQRQILTLAAAAGTGSFAVASQFFAPMAAAGTLVQFLANVASAVQRAMALRKWVDAQGESISAVSPYKTAIENFIRNQAEQFSHYTIKSAINVLKFGGQVAASSGVALPIGKVIEAGATLAETMEDVTYKFYQKAMLKSAWSTTQAALDRPENRKLGLLARKQNPTLAKYGIAYGAVVEKDQIAISAVNKCGLDRETLANKSSGVSEVKKYLETLYPDDNVVLGDYTPPGWDKSLPVPALNVKSWLLTYRTAKTKGRLATPNPSSIMNLLKDVEGPLKKPLKELKLEELQPLSKALNPLCDAFSGFEAKSENGAALADVQKLVERFANLATIKLGDVTSELQSKEAEAASKPAVVAV